MDNVFAKLKLMVIDVDGTMTDGGIYYDCRGNELKKFSVRDAAGVFALKQAGVDIVVLTGRECQATERRLNDLGIKKIFQNVKYKKLFLKDYLQENHLTSDAVGYIGDDLNDLAPMSICGFKACPADSCKEIKSIADYISSQKGGDGVIRDVIEHIMEQSGFWARAVNAIYCDSGV